MECNLVHFPKYFTWVHIWDLCFTWKYPFDLLLNVAQLISLHFTKHVISVFNMKLRLYNHIESLKLAPPQPDTTSMTSIIHIQ